MSIQNEVEKKGMSRAGAVVQKALSAMVQHVQPGITTAELDRVGEKIFEQYGARSAPREVYGFPGTNLICINDEVVHGVPGARVIKSGDLVTIDVTANLDGFIADAAITIPVSPSTPQKERLTRCAESAFEKAIAVARAGVRINEIGRAVEDEVVRCGFSVIPSLTGHGVGLDIHEDPVVANYYDPWDRTVLTEGLVITIEPIICEGSHEYYEEDDGWTIKTLDGGLAAHYEHTLIITKDHPILLTAA